MPNRLAFATIALGIALVAPCPAARAQEAEPTPERPAHVKPIELGENGKHKNVPKPLHFAPGPNDRPVVYEMYDFWQYDQKLSDMFDPKGHSEICGPTSLANALMFLRHKHKPEYPKILEKSLKKDANEEEMVECTFKLAGSPREGTGPSHILKAAHEALEQGGYSTKGTYIIAPWSTGEPEHKHPVSLHDLVEIHHANKTAILQFGWYDIEWDAKDHKWQYKRHGGHFVNLAGYDAVNPLVFYICNPGLDYKTAKHFSKIVMWPVPSQPHYIEVGGLAGDWQTESLGSAIAVLECAIVVAPE
jgi:hypothetical protein